MFDEHVDYMRAIEDTKADEPLSAELRRLWAIRDKLNTEVASRLVDTSRLKGFTGKLTTGTRMGHSVTLPVGATPPSWARFVTHNKPEATDVQEEVGYGSGDEEASDEESERVEQMANFVATMDGSGGDTADD